MSVQLLKESKYYISAKEKAKWWIDLEESHQQIDRIKFLRENLERADSRINKKYKVLIDLDYLFELGTKQNWQCALTGSPLSFIRGGTMWGGKWCNPESCTIDRIDSNKDYIKGNVQLVVWRVNCIKRDLSNEEFIKTCKLVAAQAK